MVRRQWRAEDAPRPGGGARLIPAAMRFAANLSFLFPELEFLERFAAARAAGFGAVEFFFPEGYELGDLVQVQKDSGLDIALMNLPAGKIKAFYRPPKAEERDGADDESDDGDPKVCSNCGGTGYRGRTGIFELFVVTEKIREMIKENPNIDAIRQEAVRQGMVYLQQDGMRVVIEGETSIEELLRVAK